MQRRWTDGDGEEWGNFPQGEIGEFEQVLCNGVPMPYVIAFDTDAGVVWVNMPNESGEQFIVTDPETGDRDVARAKVVGKIDLVPA